MPDRSLVVDRAFQLIEGFVELIRFHLVLHDGLIVFVHADLGVAHLAFYVQGLVHGFHFVAGASGCQEGKGD